jgi:DNA-binding SARP family transcriptional activator/tetratricopeptide (TPR) repeat protein
MLRLKSLGQTLIEVDGAPLTPAAETLFATALYLVMEAGKPVGRDELARLIWPDVSATRAQHGLRQVLYKLKSIGAEIETSRTSLALIPHSFSSDYSQLLASRPQATLEEVADQVPGPFLPGYYPRISEHFSMWVEGQRDSVHSVLTRVLTTGIGVKKDKSDWHAAERLARLCLAIDPLNEEATLTIAEGAAIGGSKARALSILSQYLDDIGADGHEIRLPAVTLRRRISEAYQEDCFVERDTPFVGREKELAELVRALQSAQTGSGGAYLIWGEPGIGKTRLVSEFTRIASLAPVRVIRVTCQAQDAVRPLSAIIDLVPKLLETPGALGCSPESMQSLRRLTSHDPYDARVREEREQGESRYDNTRTAILDLMDCVASEVCCIVVIENVHWLDPQSTRTIEGLLEWLRSRQFLLMLTSRNYWHQYELLSRIHVRPLPLEASRAIATALVNPEIAPAADFIDWTVFSAGGNPYYLLELLRYGTKERHGYRPPASLTRLLQDRVEALSHASRQLLEVCCLLGKHSTLTRIETCVQVRRARLLRALSDLDSRGLIEVDGEHVISRHDLLTSVVTACITNSAKRMLHRFIAQLLENEAAESQSVSLLWECAEHWYSAAETARAIRLLRRCGEHLMDVGMPMEAADVLARAIALSSVVEEQYDIGAQRVRALMHAEREEESLQELDRLLVLRESISPRPYQLDEVGWMHLGAQWNAGASEVDLLRINIEALAVENGAIRDRIRAAAWLLGAADNACAFELGHRIYNLALPFLDTAELAAEIRLSFEIVYHCSFGDRLKSVELAHELFAHARDYNRVPFAIRYMRYAAHTLRCHGKIEEAIKAYETAYDAAQSLHAPLAMANCAASLTATYMHVAELDAAEQWMSRAVSCRVPDKATLLDIHLLSNWCELAIKQGDIVAASKYLDRVDAANPTNASSRSKTHKLSLRTAIALAENRELTVEDLRGFRNCFEVTRRSTHQDFAVSTLTLALSRHGRVTEARELAENFVLYDRRELSVFSRDLAIVTHELGVDGSRGQYSRDDLSATHDGIDR